MTKTTKKTTKPEKPIRLRVTRTYDLLVPVWLADLAWAAVKNSRRRDEIIEDLEGPYYAAEVACKVRVVKSRGGAR